MVTFRIYIAIHILFLLEILFLERLHNEKKMSDVNYDALWHYVRIKRTEMINLITRKNAIEQLFLQGDLNPELDQEYTDIQEKIALKIEFFNNLVSLYERNLLQFNNVK